MRFLLLVTLVTSGCMRSPWRRADCDRFRYQGYNVIACDDTATGQHCAKGSRDLQSPHVRTVPRADNGKILDYLPRACYQGRAKFFGRKPTIAIGKSYMACLGHEIAHHENPDRRAWVEETYPCVGDRK